MKIDADIFRVEEGKKVKLKQWATDVDNIYHSKEHYEEILSEQVKKMQEVQELLYASNKNSLLIILQAMDAAGKDSIIKHVMSGVNPQGCQVFSFKHPSATELEHDFLWRSMLCLPERGQIVIFNRSYYEDVLIVRVHPEILQAQNLPNHTVKHKNFWQDRYQSIIDKENHLTRNGTKIIKFFLHLSKEEQRKRFIERIDDPEKNWKFNIDDMKERQYWDDYTNAYEACLSATSTKEAPWYIIPADDKKNARLFVSNVILKTLKDFKMSYPKADKKRERELKSLRELLIS